MVELLLDNQSVAGSLVSSGPIVAVAIVLSLVGRAVAGRRSIDPTARYYIRKRVAYAIAFIALIALAVLWKPFAGQIGVVEPRLI